MSLLPFTPATSPRGAARYAPDTASERSREIVPAPSGRGNADPSAARQVAQRQAAQRASDARRAEARERDAEATRTEPSDFAEMFAMLADTAMRELQAVRERERAAARATAASDADDTPSPDAVPEPLAALSGEASDRLRRALLAVPSELTETNALPRLPLAESSLPIAEAAERLPDTINLPAPLDPTLPPVLSRSTQSTQADLLARGDVVAASVRASLDALLDTAGTPRGLALADAVRASMNVAPDVTTPIRDADALAPEFRSRLERVIDRMRDEFGHDVQIVETVRSSERQEHLFAQGRTRPGPVVTWTLDSAHLTGEAADVIVDGRWNHPQGYERLQMIANQEGLRTLGMRDPGHLELRGSASEADRARAALVASMGAAANNATADASRERAIADARTATASDAFGIARVASVARVANVAAVARVASVARVGGGAVGSLEPTAPTSTTPLPNALPSTTARLGALAASNGGASGNPGGDARSDRDSARDTTRDRSASDGLAGLGALSQGVSRLIDETTARVTAPVASDAAARAEQIAVLREDAPAPSVSALTLQLESPDGPEQVRVQLRGGVVGAEVSTSSGTLADRLRLQTADLQDALGRHGLETDGVRVQPTHRTQEADAMRLAAMDRGEVLKAAGAQGGQGSTFSEQGSRERPTARNAERDPRNASDESPNQRRRDGRQEQR